MPSLLIYGFIDTYYSNERSVVIMTARVLISKLLNNKEITLDDEVLISFKTTAGEYHFRTVHDIVPYDDATIGVVSHGTSNVESKTAG